MNTQEIYGNIGKVSGRNALKYSIVTKLVVKYNMGIKCNMGILYLKDNPMLKDLEKLLLLNILMLYTKL